MTGFSREEMLNQAFVKVADTLTADFDVIDLLHTLLEECTAILPVYGGGIMLTDHNNELQLMASTNESTDFVEMMALIAGLGPCVDCFNQGVPVSVADIERDGTEWPEFREAALRRGLHSFLATPMRLRGRVIGTMNLFSTSIGEMSARDTAVAQALADVATIGILQERNLHESAVVADQLQRALSSRVLIEQAKGVLSVTGQMDLEEAFTTMRSYARQHNLALRDVAAAVADRTLDLVSVKIRASGVDGGKL